MSLIRSEHVNEQAVQASKNDVLLAERALEDARLQLEKLERTQYHEEQIWSDTIRRNSTWMTIGLMGANVFLLLASLVVIEPWRRRRLVKEIRNTLDQRIVSPISGGPTLEPLDQVEKAIDSTVEPIELSLERIEASADHVQVEATGKVDERTEAIEDILSPLREKEAMTDYRTSPESLRVDTWSGKLHAAQSYMTDCFSDRKVLVRQVDVTKAALEGMAVGAAVVGLVVALIRPR
jgi:sensitive to high expression protein 9, mitochondrial